MCKVQWLFLEDLRIHTSSIRRIIVNGRSTCCKYSANIL